MKSFRSATVVRRLHGRAVRAMTTPVDAARRAGIDVESDVVLHRGSRLGYDGAVGAHTHFSGSVEVVGVGRFEVGRWNAIGDGLRAITSNHDMAHPNLHLPLQRSLGLPDGHVPGLVRVGSATWIGDRVTMVAGASVGDGTVVAAGAVVTSTLPAFVIVGGVPARVIRPRFSDEITDVLLELQWWNWPDDRILRNARFFAADCCRVSAKELMDLVVG